VEIRYCDNCGVQIDPQEKTLTREDFKIAQSVIKIYCQKCALLFEHTTSALLEVATPAEEHEQATLTGVPNMLDPKKGDIKFYFCETCGKRITDRQIEQGLGRDKKLKGVYCRDCAVGVNTVEMLAINEETLKQKVNEHTASPITPITTPVRSDLPHTRRIAASAKATKRTTWKSAPIVLCVLGSTGMIVLLFWKSPESAPPMPGSEPHKASQTKTAAQSKPQIEPIQPAKPLLPAPEPLPDPNPAVISPAALDREREASEALEALETRAVQSDNAAQIQRLASLIDKYADTLAASRARVRLERLKNPEPSHVEIANIAKPVQQGPVVKGPNDDKYPSHIIEGFENAASHGVLIENPPAETHGRVLKSGGINAWIAVQLRFRTSDGGKFRVRYCLQEPTDFALIIILQRSGSGNWKQHWFKYTIKIKNGATKAGEWKTIEVPFSEFLSELDGRPIPANTFCGQIQLTSSIREVLFDDLEIVSGVEASDSKQ
jgi:hypothetical protein